MKFLFTADLHLFGYSQDTIKDGLPERLFHIKNVLNEMAQYCITNNISKFVIGGDLFHGKSIIHALAQKVALQFFRQYKDITFYVLDGNHDLSSRGVEYVSALMSLDSEASVVHITEKTVIEDVLFVPYGSSMINDIKQSSSKVLVSHFGLDEGLLNSGISIKADIKLSDLRDKYKLVLLGHYHKPQEIIEEDFSLYYVGSPIQLDWGEKGEEKRFLVVDTETLSVISIPTKNYKKYVEITITNQNQKDAIETAKKEMADGNSVKLIKLENITIEGVPADIVINKVEQDVTNRGITSSMTEEARFEKYLEIHEIKEKEKYMKIARKIAERDVNERN